MNTAVAVVVASWGLAAIHPIHGSDRVFALTTFAGRLTQDGSTNLVLAVWPSGHVVWSENRQSGGPPYRTGRAEPKRVAEFFDRVSKADPFGDKSLERESGVPADTEYATLFVRIDGKSLALYSIHELRPDYAGEYADIKKESHGRLFFRAVWGDLRIRAGGLIPAVSRPVSGRVDGGRIGDLLWIEGSDSKR